MDNRGMICTIKYVILNEGVVKSTCDYTTHPVYVWISAGAVEYIVMNVYVLCLFPGVRITNGLIAKSLVHRCYG